MTWQPIETAPMDKKWIITYDGASMLSDGYLIDYYDYETGGWNGTPTHWMPLPEPPK